MHFATSPRLGTRAVCADALGRIYRRFSRIFLGLDVAVVGVRPALVCCVRLIEFYSEPRELTFAHGFNPRTVRWQTLFLVLF